MSTIKQREQIFRRGFNHGYLRAIEAMQGQLSEMQAFLEDDLVKWRNTYNDKVVEPPILCVYEEVWIRKKLLRSRCSKENDPTQDGNLKSGLALPTDDSDKKVE